MREQPVRRGVEAVFVGIRGTEVLREVVLRHWRVAIIDSTRSRSRDGFAPSKALMRSACIAEATATTAP